MATFFNKNKVSLGANVVFDSFRPPTAAGVLMFVQCSQAVYAGSVNVEPDTRQNLSKCCYLQLTDKMVEKLGVQRTPAANPEMYKSDDYSAHLKGENRTMQQRERNEAGELPRFTH